MSVACRQSRHWPETAPWKIIPKKSRCGKLDGPAPIPPMTRRPRQQSWRSSLGPDHDRTGHHEMTAMPGTLPRRPTSTDRTATPQPYFRALAASARFSAQYFFVAAMIDLLPAAESFRLGLGAAAGVEGCDGFLDAAHLLRCASAMRARAAALIFRRLRFGASNGETGSAGPPDSPARSSAILASMCRFCSSNPRMAAVMISALSFVGISVFSCPSRVTHSAGAATGPAKAPRRLAKVRLRPACRCSPSAINRFDVPRGRRLFRLLWKRRC